MPRKILCGKKIITFGELFERVNIRTPVQHWQKYIVNGCIYGRKSCFEADKMVYQTMLLCSQYLL